MIFCQSSNEWGFVLFERYDFYWQWFGLSMNEQCMFFIGKQVKKFCFEMVCVFWVICEDIIVFDLLGDVESREEMVLVDCLCCMIGMIQNILSCVVK